MRLGKSLNILLVATLFAAPLSPALAGPAEIALLAKYAGDWRGTGKVSGPDAGNVTCRLSFKPSSSGKLSYSGRCTFGSQGGASFRGTMHYNDAKKQFEAATSGQGATGSTVGKRQGNSLIFNAAGIESSYGTASSTMTLNPSSIKLSFKLVDKDGQTTSSNISFSKS